MFDVSGFLFRMVSGFVENQEVLELIRNCRINPFEPVKVNELYAQKTKASQSKPTQFQCKQVKINANTGASSLCSNFNGTMNKEQEEYAKSLVMSPKNKNNKSINKSIRELKKLGLKVTAPFDSPHLPDVYVFIPHIHMEGISVTGTSPGAKLYCKGCNGPGGKGKIHFKEYSYHMVEDLH